jgi:murein L,D-transpeptidase YcbB/YkuD
MRELVFRFSQVVVIAAAILSITWKIGVLSVPAEEMQDDDSERNERSTPRSFVLPPAPIIAELYEKFDAEEARPGWAQRCLFELRRQGYPIDEMQTSFNAKLVEAIAEFQKRQGIDSSGQLDPQTIALLGCR